MHQEIFQRLLNRPADSHKYDFGHVLVLGGSPGMVGAPLLAGWAAMRTGAGLATIASFPEIIDKLERRVVEVMTLSLPHNQRLASHYLKDFISDRKVSVLVIGPGLKPDCETMVTKTIQSIKLPMIIDGGGLAILQNNPGVLKSKSAAKLILTPHMGEFQRFFDQTLPTEPRALQKKVTAFAKQHNLTLVLKGRPTYAASPDSKLYINKSGGPGLATAGSGDVLGGMIAGLIGQGVDISHAAEAAVYLHGLAGDIAAIDKTEPGVIASDVIEAIPAALKKLS